MRLNRRRFRLLDDADLAPCADEAPDVEISPECGHAGGQEIAVAVGDDTEDSRRSLGVFAEETVAVAHLDHEKDIWVLRFELEDLLLQRSVLRAFDRGFCRSNGGSGRIEELRRQLLVERGFGLFGC